MKEIKIGIYSNRVSFWSMFLTTLFSFEINDEEQRVVRIVHLSSILFLLGVIDDYSFLNDLDYVIMDCNPYKTMDIFFDKCSDWEKKKDVKFIYGEEAYEED